MIIKDELLDRIPCGNNCVKCPLYDAIDTITAALDDANKDAEMFEGIADSLADQYKDLLDKYELVASERDRLVTNIQTLLGLMQAEKMGIISCDKGRSATSYYKDGYEDGFNNGYKTAYDDWVD